MRGGLVQAGKVQCWSLITRAVQIAGVTRRRARPTSRTSPRDPRTVGMISASQARRRRTSVGARCRRGGPDPVGLEAMPVRVRWSRVTRSRAGVPWESGTRSVSRACWAVVTRASHRRAPWSRGSAPPRLGGPPGHRGPARAGEREEGGCEQGAVLGRAAAADPDPTGPVGGDGEVPVEVGGAFLTLQGGLSRRSVVSGSTTSGDVPPGPGEVGGVQMRGLGDQDPLPTTPDRTPRAGGRGRRRR